MAWRGWHLSIVILQQLLKRLIVEVYKLLQRKKVFSAQLGLRFEDCHPRQHGPCAAVNGQDCQFLPRLPANQTVSFVLSLWRDHPAWA